MTDPVLIMAGGTGGHIMPALAVADCLGKQHIPVVWLGTRQGLEAKLVPQAGYPIEWINVSGLRGKGWLRVLQAPLMLGRAWLQALTVARRLRPCAVLGMGGFASGPGGLAARCLGLPLVVHEQNAIPGMTNRCLARIANCVLEAFPESFAKSRRAKTVGNPVRVSIASLAMPAVRWTERTDTPRLLVLGGSLGAQALNEHLPLALSRLPTECRPQVWHQSGAKTFETAISAYRAAAISAKVEPFIEDMAAAYAWADLVVCRAGAITVAELAAAGVGAILVPYPYAVDDHQTANARFLERAGAARMIPQQALNAERLARVLQELLPDRAHLLAMAEAARTLARPNAALLVAQELTRYCQSADPREKSA